MDNEFNLTFSIGNSIFSGHVQLIIEMINVIGKWGIFYFWEKRVLYLLLYSWIRGSIIEMDEWMKEKWNERMGNCTSIHFLKETGVISLKYSIFDVLLPSS